MKILSHVGILGMHWGIRRQRGPASSDHTTSRTLKKKHVSELSNDDIKKVTTRLQLEKQLKDLDPHAIGVGKKMVGSFTNRFGTSFLTSFTKRYAHVDLNDPFKED